MHRSKPRVNATVLRCRRTTFIVHCCSRLLLCGSGTNDAPLCRDALKSPIGKSSRVVRSALFVRIRSGAIYSSRCGVKFPVPQI
jgi:hypothetical protein